MFWIRGVSDFFRADDAWMVRTAGVTAAARQLSARLNISVVEQADIVVLEDHHPSPLNLTDGPISVLFDAESVDRYMKGFNSLDKKLDPLLEYRQFDYWVYDNYRNLMQLVAHLANASKTLDASIPAHRSLFYECAWLYTFSVAQAAAHVRATHVKAVDASLQAYLFGGQLALQEKQKLARALSRLAPEGRSKADDGVLPDWYPQLLELLTRHLRRPYVLNDELRYAEWIAEAQAAKNKNQVSEVFGDEFSPIAAKLLADVCGFLVTVAGLEPEFRTHARTTLAPSMPQVSQEQMVEVDDSKLGESDLEEAPKDRLGDEGQQTLI